MDILLLQPPISDFYQTKVRLQPLGLAYIASTLKQELPEVDVTIADLQHNRGRKTIPLPKELKYLKDYYNSPVSSPFSTFHQYYRYGANEELIHEIIKNKPWKLIGISSLFSAYYSDVLQLTKIIKSLSNTPIVLGGAHPSALGATLLNENSIDYIIRGEGERPMVELVQALLKKRELKSVSSLIYRDNDAIITNPIELNYNLDELPIPDLQSLSKYLYDEKPIAFLMSSRACPHRCDFCSSFQVFGTKYRTRSNKNILAEIDKRVKEGIEVIDFEDDNLTANRPKVTQLLRSIIKRDYKLKLLAMNGLSYHSLDRELLELMKDAGFESLNLSLVTHADKVRLNHERPHTLSKFQDVVKAANELSLSVTSYLILGLPNQTMSEMINSIITLSELQVLIGASPFYLIPGTPIEKEFPDFEYGTFEKCRLTALGCPTPECSRDDLFTLFIICRMINYIKSFSDNESLEEVLSRDEAQPLRTLIEQNMKIHPRFNNTIFFKVWSLLKSVKTQSGNSISLATP